MIAENKTEEEYREFEGELYSDPRDQAITKSLKGLA